MATQSHKDKENFYHFSYILNREVYVWEGFLPGNGFDELEERGTEIWDILGEYVLYWRS